MPPTADLPSDTFEAFPDLPPDERGRIALWLPGGQANLQAVLPLWPMQAALLFHDRHGAEAAQPGLVLATTDEAVARRLPLVLQAMTDRHDALRAAFFLAGLQRPVQVVPRAVAAEMPLLALPAGADARAALDAYLREPIRIDRAPLLRAAFVHDAAAGRWLFGIRIHHAVVDHASRAILLDELALALQGRALPPAPPALACLPWRAFDDGDAAFFRARLGHIEAPCEPFGASLVRPVGTGRQSGLRRATARLPEALSGAVRRAAEAAAVAPSALFHAAWALAAARGTGSDEVVFGTVLSTRRGPWRTQGVGAFINTLPLRVSLVDVDALGLVRGIQRELAALRRRAHVPLAQAQRCSGVPAPAALFTSLLNVRHQAAPAPGVEILQVDEEAGHPLALTVDDDGSGHTLALQCQGCEVALDPQALLAIWQAALGALATALGDAPQTPALQLEVLPAEQQAVALRMASGPATRVPVSLPLWLADTAARTPQAPAVRCSGFALSHAELDARADRLARRLVARGVRRGDRVALHLERGIGWVVALVAAMKAGAVAMPLDLSHPPGRIAALLADAAPRAVLYGEDVAADHDAPGQALPDVGLDDLAYLLYTSGSSGRPKGVAMPQRGIANLLQGERLGAPPQRTAQFAAPGFDVALQEVFGTLGSGGTLCIVPEDARREPAHLLRFLADERIERLYLPCVALARLADAADRAAFALPDLADVVVSGEALRITAPIERFFGARPHCRLHNQYGPTETHVVTSWRMTGPGPWPALPPIGRPIGGVQVHVLDARLRPAPVGVAGEICVGGAAPAAGYWNDPGDGAEQFVSDPFSSDAKARLYRTGDIGRRRADGTLEFIGRADRQAKIRGHRIEPGEVEAHIVRLPGVREAAVLVRGDTDGERRLVAFVVADGSESLAAEALRAALAQALPEVMLPAEWFMLDRLPVTANGKLDRRALAAVEGAQPLARAYEAPQGPIEEMLAAIWRELLGIARVGRDDVFFELGGHSLLATQVAARVEARLGVELALKTLFAQPSLRGMAAAVAALRPAATPGSDTPAGTATIPPASRERPLPASFSQRRMWLVQQLDPATTAYNIPFVLQLRGALDRRRFAAAVGRVTARHEAFRTRFEMRGGELVQLIGPPRAVPLHWVDGVPGGDVTALVAEHAAVRFDLAAADLCRITLIRSSPEVHLLVWVMHHAIADQWSGGILLRELDEACRALAEGREPAWPPLAIDYADYAAWQHGEPHLRAIAGQRRFWHERLKGLQPLALPADRLRTGMPSGRGASVSVPLARETIEAVRAFGQPLGATPFMTLLACFQLLLARLGGQADVAVGVPIANRRRIEAEALVGTLVNTLVMRTDLAGEPSFRALLGRVRETALEAYAHQDVPFEQLVEDLAPARDVSHAPLVQVLFNVINVPFGAKRIGELTLEPLAFDRGAAQFDLSLTVDTDLFGLIHLEYASDLFERATAERLVRLFTGLVAQVIADPQRPIGSYALLDAHDEALLSEWHGPPAAPPADMRVDQWIAAGAAAHAHRPAIRCGIERLTHGEVQAASNRLARALRARGIARGRTVGLALARSSALPIAQLAVMKAGAAWVPLDPDYPRARLEHVARDADLALVIDDGALRGALDWPDALTLRLPDAGPEIAALSGDPLPPDPRLDAGPADLAYVLHTSGSTGLPKGVAVPHAAVVNFLASMAREPGLGAEDRLLAVTTPCFDISVLELMLPLAVGAEVVIARREQVRDGHALRALVEACMPTAMQATPSGWRLLIAAGWRGDRGLRALVGGEALSADLAAALAERAGSTWNMYGPTETTVWSTCERIERGRPIGIGRPIAHTRVHIVDEHGAPCAIGMPGEICIGGAGLAVGYLNRSEETAQRFVLRADGERLYRTGDRGRWRSDGRLEHLGRLDRQLKLRGHRIEPSEIEAALVLHAGASEAVVELCEDRPGEARLVAYLVADDPAALHTPALRERLRGVLPEYMLPQQCIALPSLPLLPNGKIDRRSLPAPAAGAQRAPTPHAEPRSETERRMAEIWREALGVVEVHPDDNFFDLGGHSMLAMQVVQRIQERIGVRVAPRQVIYETLAQTAAACEAQCASPRRSRPARAPEETMRLG